MGDGLRRRTNEGKQAFPWILSNQPHATVCLDGLVDHRVPIDLLQNRIKVFVQSKEIGQKRFIHPFPFIEEEVAFLIKREDPIRGLDNIGLVDLRESEELPPVESL